MKCLIVLSLLCIAANAYAETDDDVLVEKLLKRYEEHQEKKRDAASAALAVSCVGHVNAFFGPLIFAFDEQGQASPDFMKLVTACGNSGSVGIATQRMFGCLREEAKQVAAATNQGKRATFARQAQGNCATAAPVLNAILAGDQSNEATFEDVCNFNGGVSQTVGILADCIDPTKEPNPPPAQPLPLR